jgi:carbon storage regulator
MLVLTRKTAESIVIGDGIEIRVLEISGGRVRLGVTAPADVPVHRSEVAARVELFLDADTACLSQVKLSANHSANPVAATGVRAGSPLPTSNPCLMRRPR